MGIKEKIEEFIEAGEEIKDEVVRKQKVRGARVIFIDSEKFIEWRTKVKKFLKKKKEIDNEFFKDFSKATEIDDEYEQKGVSKPKLKRGIGLLKGLK